MKKITASDLIKLREKRGWTQEEAARQTGYTRTYINLVENGKKPMPAPMQKIVACLLSSR